MNLCTRFAILPFLSLFLFLSVPGLAYQNPPTPSPLDNGKPSETGGAQPIGAPVDSKNYKVGPEDVLFIRVWHEPDFSGPVAVHSDGKFTIALLGDLQAGGLTPAEIEQNLTKALSAYVKKPLVTVIVQEVRSKKYYLDGEVNRAGEYSLVAPTTVLEALSKAGGLQEFANEKKIYVLRGTRRIPFNYKEVIRGKHLEQNIQLEANDHVVVP
jgi:polysaccharide export outer membrane protein